jgi:uncharacterized protein (UPF0332 family)/predicted nucleotidyltransferase
MAKQKKPKEQPKKEEKTEEQIREEQALSQLPPEVQEKLKAIKSKLETFKNKILEKYEKYTVGIALMPPPQKQEEIKPEDKDKIHVLMLLDDSDSKARDEIIKIPGAISEIAKNTDKDIEPHLLPLSEVWQDCYDCKYETLQMIAYSAPVYDKGMLSALKISEIHKSMVLKKFEKYIVSYVLAGSLTQGKATKDSDIDVFIVIDDTDVKRMTRAELKDKLRAIIIGMAIEAGEITGIKNKLNVQVYILTDFWDSIREANPIIFTFLRDGIPLYDRGIFMPWKQLLKMGRIKPSQEAIDLYMGSGEQMLKRVQYKLNEIGMEDMFYAILTPSQAALMMYGVPPPTPKETPEMMREIFVKKEKMFEEEYVKILEKIIDTRKQLEHGTKKEVSGAEVDSLLKDSEKYLKRITKLFDQINKIKEKESIVHIYDSAITVVRDLFKIEGIESKDDVEKIFKEHIVHKGKVPQVYLRSLQTIIKAKKDYDAGKITKAEIEKVKKYSTEFMKFIIEQIQRKRGKDLERTKIRVKHGEKYGEVILLDKAAFIIHDIDNTEREISKADILPNGGLYNIQKSSMEELEKYLVKMEIPAKTFIKEKIFENLKEIFGRDVEILMNY